MTANTVHVGLIGDHDPRVTAHRAIPHALRLADEACDVGVEFEWVATDEIHSAARVSGFDGLWCVPASPYRNMEGALIAIAHARVHLRPFLGTCGGFQHAVIEYARSRLGWADAEHAGTRLKAQPKRPCRNQPCCAPKRQPPAKDPHQRAVGGLRDEVVALGERTVPPAGLDALGPAQQLQRRAVEQRQVAAARRSGCGSRSSHTGRDPASNVLHAETALDVARRTLSKRRAGRRRALGGAGLLGPVVLHAAPGAAPARRPRRACNRSIRRTSPSRSLFAVGNSSPLGGALRAMSRQRRRSSSVGAGSCV